MKLKVRLRCKVKCVIIIYNIFLWVDPRLFKGFCLTEINSKFTQEKSIIFIFSLCLVLLVCVNDTMFHSVQYKNNCLGASDLFHMLTQSIKFYRFHYYVLKSIDVWKMLFIKKTLKMNGCSFQQVLPQNLGWFLS